MLLKSGVGSYEIEAAIIGTVKTGIQFLAG